MGNVKNNGTVHLFKVFGAWRSNEKGQQTKLYPQMCANILALSLTSKKFNLIAVMYQKWRQISSKKCQECYALSVTRKKVLELQTCSVKNIWVGNYCMAIYGDL
jgi:hypothetical protein